MSVVIGYSTFVNCLEVFVLTTHVYLLFVGEAPPTWHLDASALVAFVQGDHSFPLLHHFREVLTADSLRDLPNGAYYNSF